mgnify:FL=1|jgi:glutamine amidotransferase
MIAIIDYGHGNLQSVYKALSLLNFESQITDSIKDIENAHSLIFPGVGAFGDCMQNLDDKGLTEIIKKSIKSGKPFLGICLGLQILFESSEESPGVQGLSIFKGSISKMNFNKNKLKVPHMGWNQIKMKRKSKLFESVEDESWVYFVHSYKIDPDLDIVDTTSSYGDDFGSSVSFENIYATQFHPEKSSDLGLNILGNFCKV